jgi:hypothetical protein
VAPVDPLPAPTTLDAELKELIYEALRLRQAYRRVYVLGLGASGSSAIAVFGSGGDPAGDIATVGRSKRDRGDTPKTQADWRADARQAAKRIREAGKMLGNAAADLRWGEAQFRQPEAPEGRAVVSPEEFAASLKRREERNRRGEDYGEA